MFLSLKPSSTHINDRKKSETCEIKTLNKHNTSMQTRFLLFAR